MSKHRSRNEQIDDLYSQILQLQREMDRFAQEGGVEAMFGLRDEDASPKRRASDVALVHDCPLGMYAVPEDVLDTFGYSPNMKKKLFVSDNGYCLNPEEFREIFPEGRDATVRDALRYETQQFEETVRRVSSIYPDVVSKILASASAELGGASTA